VQSRRNIWTGPAQGGQPVAVTDDNFVNWSPVLFPDAAICIFRVTVAATGIFGECRSLSTRARRWGAPEAVTTPSLYSGHVSFSHHGRRIAYIAADANLQCLQSWIRSREGSDHWSTGSDYAATRQIACCSISPDGEWLAARTFGKQENLLLLRADGSSIRQLTDESYKKS